MLNTGAVAWKSRRQPTVALSTLESEYMALTDATKELKWVGTLLAELGYSNGKSDDPTDLQYAARERSHRQNRPPRSSHKKMSRFITISSIALISRTGLL